MSSMRAKLEAQLQRFPQRADLRLALAQACAREKDWNAVADHAQAALKLKADYSAAYLLAGRAAVERADAAAAKHFYQEGMAQAQAQGDKQIERQIQVFLKRLELSE